MPSISARAASSSTTRTRPRLGPFWAAVGGTATILRCARDETGAPARRSPHGCPRRVTPGRAVGTPGAPTAQPVLARRTGTTAAPLQGPAASPVTDGNGPLPGPRPEP